MHRSLPDPNLHLHQQVQSILPFPSILREIRYPLRGVQARKRFLEQSILLHILPPTSELHALPNVPKQQPSASRSFKHFIFPLNPSLPSSLHAVQRQSPHEVQPNRRVLREPRLHIQLHPHLRHLCTVQVSFRALHNLHRYSRHSRPIHHLLLPLHQRNH